MSFVEAEKLRQLLRMKLLYSGSMSTTILRLLLESTASKQVKREAADSMWIIADFGLIVKRLRQNSYLATKDTRLKTQNYFADF
jgi:uncharacterized hydantoinase/oxoprolinase family protein